MSIRASCGAGRQRLTAPLAYPMFRPKPQWRNGRRGRLKICCRQRRAGSSPAWGTTSSRQIRNRRSIKANRRYHSRPRNGNLKANRLGVMPKRTAFPLLLTLTMLLAAGYALGWPSREAQAQQGQQFDPGGPPPRRGLTLRDVWGPPKMPAEPKDFGPHFDFPAGGSENLTCGPQGSQYFCGAPSEAPYAH